MTAEKARLFDETRLSVAALYATAVDFDWSEGYGETWDAVSPDFSGLTDAEKQKYLSNEGDTSDVDADYLDKLRQLIRFDYEDEPEPEPDGLDKMGYEELRAICEAHGIPTEEADEEYSEALAEACATVAEANPDAFTPMISYYYPLPEYRGDAGQDQVKLDLHCACVLAEVNGETVLALAGGGMDLSADICLAYCLLGYLPPLEYARTSGFYRGEGKRRPELIAACRRSWEVVKGWAEQGMADFDRIAKEAD